MNPRLLNTIKTKNKVRPVTCINKCSTITHHPEIQRSPCLPGLNPYLTAAQPASICSILSIPSITAICQKKRAFCWASVCALLNRSSQKLYVKKHCFQKGNSKGRETRFPLYPVCPVFSITGFGVRISSMTS